LSPDIISRSDDDVQLTATTITVDGSIGIHQPQMDGVDTAQLSHRFQMFISTAVPLTAVSEMSAA